MKRICFYSQVHQPYRVSEYSVLDTGSGKRYFLGPKRATRGAYAFHEHGI